MKETSVRTKKVIVRPRQLSIYAGSRCLFDGCISGVIACCRCGPRARSRWRRGQQPHISRFAAAAGVLRRDLRFHRRPPRADGHIFNFQRSGRHAAKEGATPSTQSGCHKELIRRPIEILPPEFRIRHFGGTGSWSSDYDATLLPSRRWNGHHRSHVPYPTITCRRRRDGTIS